MDRASRIRILSIRLNDKASVLRGFADALERGDPFDRFTCGRLGELVASIVHDAGALDSLTSDVVAPTSEREQTELLIDEIEGRTRPPDPPGRITPGERPSTRSGIHSSDPAGRKP